MPGANYCSRSLALQTINPCGPVFDNRSLTEVRGEHLAVNRGRLMTRDLHKKCTKRGWERAMLLDDSPDLDGIPKAATRLRWDSQVRPEPESFPRTLALYHPLRRLPVASLRLSPLAPTERKNGLFNSGLLVREAADEPLVDFASTAIARRIRRTAGLVDRRGGFLLSLERLVGHLGDQTLNAAAMLQAIVKLVVHAPRRVEGIVAPVPGDSPFLRLLGPLEEAELAPVCHLGQVNARLLRFTDKGVLKDTRTVDLHILHIDVLHLRHTLELLDEFESGDPARRLLDTAIVTRTFLKRHLAQSHTVLAPELQAIVCPNRKNVDEPPPAEE
ncbi:hypothetical protein FIV42_10375 [Persicimonas caeni]|uniref:Uncharacterized protein n=1 Tax=Persicimonas caeni TaxID=2292766 RepID=A0A4Y6PTM7_PERCE|nr:hypothetical protein [Persicimonas caeni]QDG51125.1 hypothetical protein FIV42_10375 [Persicimonas caeni]QED32346.1 hypothetical protein FRD00_10370 [Persicimonas caeni]